MQELTWSETHIEGGRGLSVVLPQPPTRLGYYRDAAVVAFPTPVGDESLPLPQVVDIDGKPLPHAASALNLRSILSTRLLSQAPGVPSAIPVAQEEEVADLPATFDLVFPHPVEVRSIFIRGTKGSGRFQTQVSVWDDASATFRTVATLNSHTSAPFADHIGSVGFAAVKAVKFRLAFDRKEGQRVQLETLRLSGGFRVADWTVKVGFSSEPVNPNPDDCQPQKGDAIPLAQVIDLTDRMEADGKLSWSAPAGYWTILRIGHTPTGIYLFPTPVGGLGLDCDKLSREAADFHYDQCVKPLLQEFGTTLTRRAMAYYHHDSYESGWQNWTAKFPENFRERRGYDLVKYMPALTGRAVGNIETTEKFLWDFRRTIGDLFADNNY
jgi:hypothetical protein